MTPALHELQMEEFESAMPRLLKMMRALHADSLPHFSDADTVTATRELLRNPHAGMIWTIQWDEQIVGYVALTFGFSLEYDGWYGVVDELFVEKEWRSRGCGTMAVRRCAEECARRGVAALLLEADLVNDGATRLYRRLGFQEHARRLMQLDIELH